MSFGKELAVFNGVAARSDYDAIYQYDALGRSDWIGTGGEQAWYASRFRCAGSGDVAAVSFYTPVPGTGYEVRVAGSVGDVAAAPVAASGTIAVGGYHTVRLTRPAAVTAGDVFVAAVRVTTPGWSSAGARGAPVGPHRPPRPRRAVVPERGRRHVDRPDGGGGPGTGQRLPQGVRRRRRRRGQHARRSSTSPAASCAAGRPPGSAGG